MALILDDDVAGSGVLQHMLHTLGYEAHVMTDAGSTLDALRASAEPVAVFFNVEAYGETLDGQGYTALIGALLEDPALMRRHMYAVVSSTADDVEWILGKTLDRMNAPVFNKPCAATAVEAFLALARGRTPLPPPTPEIATI